MADERLDPREMERYQGHLALPGLGVAGQRRLRRAAVLLVGVGGLGCPVAQYVVASGVGRLTLVDDDVVDTTNLQRQVLFGDADVGRPKAEVAAERLRALNAGCELVPRVERIGAGNARAAVDGHDLVVDGSDNFPTRYVLNDACVLEGLPLVSGSLYRYEGQVTVIRSPDTPCYRCLFRSPPGEGASCREVGILGPMAGMIGAIQAIEAVRLLATGTSALAGRLLLADCRSADFRSVALARDPGCPLCGEKPSIREPTSVTACEAPGA